MGLDEKLHGNVRIRFDPRLFQTLPRATITPTDDLLGSRWYRATGILQIRHVRADVLYGRWFCYPSLELSRLCAYSRDCWEILACVDLQARFRIQTNQSLVKRDITDPCDDVNQLFWSPFPSIPYIQTCGLPYVARVPGALYERLINGAWAQARFPHFSHPT